MTKKEFIQQYVIASSTHRVFGMDAGSQIYYAEKAAEILEKKGYTFEE